ncbi:MAG TPA: DUF2785 domain-containing protein [Vicinamibacteria bacterium]
MTLEGPVVGQEGRVVAWRAVAVLAAGSFLLPVGPAAAEPAPAERRGRAFWQALAAECAVPAGESAFGLVGEAVSLLGHPDPFWRDDVGYGVVATCAYRKKLLKPEERRALVARLSGNLRQGIGETGTDATLLRSFSALDLSILAAVETADPALDDAGYRKLLDDAFAYLRDERDRRGLDPRVGWIHATAHTADLLKFLARDGRFGPGDQGRLLDAVWETLTAPGTPVFTHGEDERLAAAIVSVVRRADFDASRLAPWLARFVEQEKGVWAKAPPERAALDASQNARSLLRSLYVLLSLPAPGGPAAALPAPGAAAARDRVLATLGEIRR